MIQHTSPWQCGGQAGRKAVRQAGQPVQSASLGWTVVGWLWMFCVCVCVGNPPIHSQFSLTHSQSRSPQTAPPFSLFHVSACIRSNMTRRLGVVIQQQALPESKRYNPPLSSSISARFGFVLAVHDNVGGRDCGSVGVHVCLYVPGYVVTAPEIADDCRLCDSPRSVGCECGLLFDLI